MSHNDRIRRCRKNPDFKNRINIGLDIFCGSPAGRAELIARTEFFRIFAAHIQGDPKRSAAASAKKQVDRMETREEGMESILNIGNGINEFIKNLVLWSKAIQP